MRIIAGSEKGRALAAPAPTTRPTADRVRQALFDMLRHAPWAGGALDRPVLDAFAGTGALGLEALSRGAPVACFIERDRAALRCIAANIATCRMGDRALLLPGDAARPPPPPPGFAPLGLLFLDPPYGAGLLAPALSALDASGWMDCQTLVVAELSADEPAPSVPLLAERRHGAAQLYVFRSPGAPLLDPARGGAFGNRL